METRIHPSSGLALLPQLSLWEVPPTQDSVEQDYDHEVRPVSTFTSDTPIRFEIKSPTNEYVNLGETYLSIKVKLTLTQSSVVTADSWKTVKLAKNFLHSLFKHVNIEIGGKQVDLSPSLYSFKAYFNTVLGYSKTAKDGFLESIGWNITNLNNLTSTADLTLDLFGIIHTDLTFQDKWIIGGADMTIELIPNNVSFYVSCGENQKVSSQFLDCCLFVNRNRVSHALESAHQKALTKSPCRYPFVRTDVRAVTLASGTNDYLIDNVASGFLPRRIFIALSDASEMQTKPYNFKNFGLNYLAAYQDGNMVPLKPFTPDFTKKMVTREFVSFYRALNQNNTDPIWPMKINEWIENPVFGINFSPDESPGVSAGSHVNHKRLGHLRLHLKFNSQLTAAVAVLIFMEYDSILECDLLRNIHVTY